MGVSQYSLSWPCVRDPSAVLVKVRKPTWQESESWVTAIKSIFSTLYPVLVNGIVRSALLSRITAGVAVVRLCFWLGTEVYWKLAELKASLWQTQLTQGAGWAMVNVVRMLEQNGMVTGNPSVRNTYRGWGKPKTNQPKNFPLLLICCFPLTQHRGPCPSLWRTKGKVRLLF